jgi:hypothetical protein
VSEQPAEFYGSVQIMPESDPTTDPLLTVRMQPPNTWERRYDGNTPRAVKTHLAGHPVWALVNGAVDGEPWLFDDEVRTWPVQHPLVWGVAYDRLAGKVVPPPASAPTAELVGDMGVESFRGGES